MKDVNFNRNTQDMALEEIYGDIHSVVRIFRLFIYSTLLGVVAGVLIVLTNKNYDAAVILSLGLIPIFASLYLVNIKKFENAITLMAVFFILLNTLLSTIGLGIHSINNVAFPVILIIASLVTSRRVMFFLTFLTVLALGWLVFGELFYWYTPGILVRSVPGDFLSAAVIVVLTGIMVHRLTSSLFHSFRQLKREVQDRKSLEERLRHREALLEAVTFAAEQFLKTANWREVIDAVLQKLGSEFDASHAYLFEKHPGENGEELSSMTYEWSAPGIPSDLGNPEFQNLPTRSMGFERMYEQLDRGEPLVGSTSYFNAFEKEYMDSIGVRALLETRVTVKGTQWGTIGFDEVAHDREWSPMEVDATRVAAGVLGAAIERRLNEDKLQDELTGRQVLIRELEHRNAELETLRETTEIITSTLNRSEVVSQILRQLKRVVRYDSASVWLFTGSTAYLIGSDGLQENLPRQTQHIIDKNEPDYPLWAEDLPYVLFDDIQVRFEKFRDPPLEYIRSWLAIPLKLRGKFTGFISLDGKAVGQFTRQDARLALNYANQIAIALENTRLFSDLQQELGERQKLIGELEDKNGELERFTYSVSHDLKSPLVTIDGFLRYIERDIINGDMQRFKSDMHRVHEAVSKMQKLLMELLELSRVGRAINPPTAVSFAEIANEGIEAVHGRLSSNGVKTAIQPNLPIVIGDRPRLVEVVQNLIDNAAKYMGSQRDPQIEIGLGGTEDGKAVFFVKDNGMGVAPEHHARIFELFNKLDPKTEGSGVGLALVKRIIEVHGGRIWVESEAGKGSTFFFTLPVS